MPTTTEYPTIKLFNTMARAVEVFTPIKRGQVGIYSCGPTVYHDVHIGNMRAFIFADILRRTFDYADYKVTQVMNITDVGHLTDDANDGEDKMIVAMRREGMDAWDIAKKYTDTFLKHCRLLNIHRPDYMPHATDHIPEQITMIKHLEEKGYTYKTSDGIYFDTSKLKDYGHLARLDIEGLKAGERVDMGEKRNITDFALWKFSPTDSKRDMEWASPWGVGFPGWHIECSAMAGRYLGDHFDIHTGGIDLIPVHHSNEIAQSECANDCRFVNYWMHTAFLNLKGGLKMSKSSGDFLTLDSIIARDIDPLAFRYLCLMCHYRMGMDFDWEGLKAAATGYRRLVDRVQTLARDVDIALVTLGGYAQEYIAKIDADLFDDLNTSKVLAHIWTLLDDSKLTSAEKSALVARYDAVLQLELLTHEKQEIVVPTEVQELIKAREEARKARDFNQADELRNKIVHLGYNLKDTNGKTEVIKL